MPYAPLNGPWYQFRTEKSLIIESCGLFSNGPATVEPHYGSHRLPKSQHRAKPTNNAVAWDCEENSPFLIINSPEVSETYCAIPARLAFRLLGSRPIILPVLGNFDITFRITAPFEKSLPPFHFVKLCQVCFPIQQSCSNRSLSRQVSHIS